MNKHTPGDWYCGEKSELSQVTGTVKVWTTSEFEAAAELRRLQAENERLHQINQSHEMKLSVRGYKIQINDLKAMNAELLDALKSLLWYVGQLEMLVYSADDAGEHEEVAKASAAIAKAEGKA